VESLLLVNNVDSALFLSVQEEQTVRSKFPAVFRAVHSQSCT